jgi:hypothetical protein
MLVGSIAAGRGGSRLPAADWQALGDQIQGIQSQLEGAEPYTVCPDCLGRGCPPETKAGRPLCRGVGFISRRQYRKLPEAAEARLRNRTESMAAAR